MQLHGWIIYNGSLPGKKFLDFAEWIQRAAIRKGGTATIYKNSELLSYLNTENLSLLKDERVPLPNYVLFADKDVYLARQLELLGLRVFNRAEAIAVSDDKIATYQQLAIKKLPIPRTIIAPKTFFSEEPTESVMQIAVDTFGFPMIVKEAFGSFGQQVYLIETKEQLLHRLQQIDGKPYMFQEFISTSYGKDLRLHVVGNHVVAAMRRQAVNDFRANVSAGGSMEAYEPSEYETKIAVAATKAIGADFAGVDLLFGPDQSPIICEINSNAHIRNIYDCTNINVADYIIDYIYKSCGDNGGK
ncbi:RimK family alpha-L-glutamate ligase [Virgibacillus salarius]|uniref:ATP-grasp domain-containing protein n=1 Tax=Virgibacillus salarius TaxID=447199 RepID=UPI002492C7E0|nr:RimK family alpha-L-glutamate ligase [Virgibacillus salarius]WBX79009.1 RimK family alpha-L-glutamate ligase [Virgibacillus salarius]